jgi:GR25 family glycosyltransferase involved in LPS biosynthesis
MKSFVITILDNEKSVASADTCIQSAAKFNIDVNKFDAITPSKDPEAIAKQKNVPTDFFRNKFSRYENCLSAFLSHFSLWEQCSVDTEEFLILEHDAYFVAPVPSFIPHKGCISLGKPSYGSYKTPSALGVNPLTSKKYFPGAHAYLVKPAAARQLIETAKQVAGPTDVFLGLNLFNFLEEYYPWPVEARDSFTTIQQETGCLAKHNYNEKYEII